MRVATLETLGLGHCLYLIHHSVRHDISKVDLQAGTHRRGVSTAICNLSQIAKQGHQNGHLIYPGANARPLSVKSRKDSGAIRPAPLGTHCPGRQWLLAS
jgi:hypothetical protein